MGRYSARTPVQSFSDGDNERGNRELESVDLHSQRELEPILHTNHENSIYGEHRDLAHALLRRKTMISVGTQASALSTSTILCPSAYSTCDLPGSYPSTTQAHPSIFPADNNLSLGSVSSVSTHPHFPGSYPGDTSFFDAHADSLPSSQASTHPHFPGSYPGNTSFFTAPAESLSNRAFTTTGDTSFITVDTELLSSRTSTTTTHPHFPGSYAGDISFSLVDTELASSRAPTISTTSAHPHFPGPFSVYHPASAVEIVVSDGPFLHRVFACLRFYLLGGTSSSAAPVAIPPPGSREPVESVSERYARLQKLRHEALFDAADPRIPRRRPITLAEISCPSRVARALGVAKGNHHQFRIPPVPHHNPFTANYKETDLEFQHNLDRCQARYELLQQNRKLELEDIQKQEHEHTECVNKYCAEADQPGGYYDQEAVRQEEAVKRWIKKHTERLRMEDEQAGQIEYELLVGRAESEEAM